MTKTELQAKIEALQEALKTKSQEQNAYQNQVDTLKKQLADLNKPKLTPLQFDELTTFVECGIEEFDFDDLDNYSIDYGIDYDNRVTCESFCFDNVDELARVVCEKVYTMFAEANEDTNEENQD
tara:strand:- start:337 stop:708 length:372 start_codon:yes stop_codon:yes gene_type:complete